MTGMQTLRKDGQEPTMDMT